MLPESLLSRMWKDLGRVSRGEEGEERVVKGQKAG